MSIRAKVFTGIGIWIVSIVVFAIVFGWSRNDNDDFKPQEEFRLDTWFSIGPLDVNKGVLYVFMPAVLMCWTMIYAARRMREKPNRVQTLVEVSYVFMRDQITRSNMDDKMAVRWFPLVASLFLFIWFSNVLGYLPLPTNTAHKVDVFGAELPGFALYAATANLSVPLVLAAMVWITYNIVGIKDKGFVGYIKSFIPAGVPAAMRPFILILELASNFMRLISLSVRLFANLLAGHLIILFMAGALVVILGIEALGVITLPMGIALFMFELGLIATLQAFIFATLTAIYLGGATADSH